MNNFELQLATLQLLAASEDTEVAHIEADDILREILTALGYSEIVEAYDAIGKWYA